RSALTAAAVAIAALCCTFLPACPVLIVDGGAPGTPTLPGTLEWVDAGGAHHAMNPMGGASGASGSIFDPCVRDPKNGAFNGSKLPGLSTSSTLPAIVTVEFVVTPDAPSFPPQHFRRTVNYTKIAVGSDSSCPKDDYSFATQNFHM